VFRDRVRDERSDPRYREALRATDVVTADGMSVVWALRFLGRSVPSRVNFTETLDHLLARPWSPPRPAFVLGCEEAVNERFCARIEGPGTPFRVVGRHHGYFRPDEEDALVDRIRASGASLLLVGLGVPGGEIFLYRNRERLGVAVGWAVGGGTMNILAGAFPWAPHWMRRAGLEWLHRLALEPRRMARRYLLGNPEFLLRVLAERFRGTSGGGS
jgi:N-acetylglucosaminyldiphosphoundecaprenol N-acetyl-beta-D-mannosaminyltransferase